MLHVREDNNRIRKNNEVKKKLETKKPLDGPPFGQLLESTPRSSRGLSGSLKPAPLRALAVEPYSTPALLGSAFES